MQPGLFDAEQPQLDRTFATARRLQLDERSWIEHVPGWLTGSQTLLDQLLQAAVWEQRDRWMFDRKVQEPRLTAEYADLASAPNGLITEIAEALSEHYAARYETLWINLYRDHRDSTSWHGDAVGKRQRESTVPVLSLGAARRFLIRPRDGGKSYTFTPAGGDLIVMGGRAQIDWRHMVPKQTAEAGPRISVNFAPS